MSDPYGGLPSAPPPPPGGGNWGQPQGGWQQQPYGGYGHTQKPPRPSTVDTAFLLMLVHCLLAAISVAIVSANADELKRKVLDKTPDASKATLDAIVPIAIGTAVVGLVIYLGLALFVRAGKNWARIVTWVFGGLAIVSVLVSLGQPTIAASRALGLITAVVDIVIVVLLALRASNDYFRSPPPQYR